MCDFDFFYVMAYADTVTALKRAGVPRDKINKVVDWNVPTPYPKVSYEATIGSFNVMGIGHERARQLTDEFVANQQRIDGVRYHVRFIAVD